VDDRLPLFIIEVLVELLHLSNLRPAKSGKP
jgi:hypothetical protein